MLTVLAGRGLGARNVQYVQIKVRGFKDLIAATDATPTVPQPPIKILEPSDVEPPTTAAGGTKTPTPTTDPGAVSWTRSTIGRIVLLGSGGLVVAGLVVIGLRAISNR